MIKRLKRMYELSKKDPKALSVLESLTPEQISQIPDAGDGSAVFFSEGSAEEYEDFKREEDGTKSWYERLKNL